MPQKTHGGIRLPGRSTAESLKPSRAVTYGETFQLKLHTAVSTKVVQEKPKNIHDNAKRQSGKYSINFNTELRIHFVSFNIRKQVFTAPPSMALKTREVDDGTVNNHNPSCLSVLSRTL